MPSSATKMNTKGLKQQTLQTVQKPRVETASSRAREAAVDPGPSGTKTSSKSTPLLGDTTWDLKELVGVCKLFRKNANRSKRGSLVYGTRLFRAWDQDADFSHTCAHCDHYGSFFLDPPSAVTWEAMANEVLKINESDWKKVKTFLTRVLDRSKAINESGKETDLYLPIRQFTIGLVSQDPLSVFGYSEDEDIDDFSNRYWDKSKLENPRLRVEDRPLAKFWLIACDFLGWPWIDPEVSSLPEEFEELQAVAASRKRERLVEKRFRSSDDGPSKSAPVDPQTPARGSGFKEVALKPVQDPIDPRTTSHSSSTPGTSSALPNPAPADSQTLARVSGPREGLSMSAQESPEVRPPSRPSSQLDTPHSGSTLRDVAAKPSAVTPPGVDNRPSLWSDDETSQHSVAKKPSTKSTSTSVPVKEIRFTEQPVLAAKGVAFRALEEGIAKKRSAREKFESDAEKARELTQMTLDGIPRKFAEFLCVTVSWYWRGDNEEDGTVQDRGAEIISERFKRALKQSPKDLLFLPVSDFEYQDKDRWLRSPDDTLKSFEDLKPYLDLQWNRGYTIPRAGFSAGEKTFRFRIRVAFNSPHMLIEPMLHQLFSDTGYNVGVFRSLLQCGVVVRIGWLLKYPLGMGREAMEQELMRHFKFKIPIALEYAYPTNPGSNGRKWAPGIGQHAWHVYVPAAYAQLVDHELSIWLTKTTRKRDMPFGASTQYIHCWRAIQQRIIPVRVTKDFTEALVGLVNTHDNFCTVTAVLTPPFPTQVLVKQKVELFGGKEMSLLRILYAIQCNPPESEEASHSSDPMDADIEESEGQDVPGKKLSSAPLVEMVDSSSEESEQRPQKGLRRPRRSPNRSPKKPSKSPAATPTSKSSKSSKKAGSLPPKSYAAAAKAPVVPPAVSDRAALAALEKGPETLAEKKARLNKVDVSNHQASPLFLMILPSEIEGFYIFVVRDKYKQLAENVLNGLASFLTCYLELSSDTNYQRKLLRGWLCKHHIESTARYAMTWDEKTHQALSEFDKNDALEVDEADEWLDRFSDTTTTPPFTGTLTINLCMPSVSDIDDGATVVSRLNEARRLQQVASEHAEMVEELEVKDAQLEQTNAELHAAKDSLAAERKKAAAHEEQIRRLQAQLAEQAIRTDDGNPGQHNDSTVQADARGGSSGSGS